MKSSKILTPDKRYKRDIYIDKKLYKKLKNVLIYGGSIQKNASLEHLHTYRIKCKAKWLITVTNESELICVLSLLYEHKKHYFILGKGSNVLFTKKKVRSIVVNIKQTQQNKKDVKFYRKKFVSAFAGVSTNYLMHFAKERSLSGLEFLSLIPASVGGACFMNAGSFNSSMQKVVYKVKYFYNGKVFLLKANQKHFLYRSTIFKKMSAVIISVTFKLENSTSLEVGKKMRLYGQTKKENQPLEQNSCGSVFKNGNNYFAAVLVQNLNLKGKRVGGAQISQKHANFIVNLGDAKAKHVLKLIKIVKKKIKKHYNICILLEVVLQ